jgi:hypothetical protein
MTTNTNPIAVIYSDSKLRILVEEYITMQKHDFTFKSLCSYVLYCAMEEEKTANEGLYESNQLSPADCERISGILRKIVIEGRLTCGTDTIVDDTQFVKVKE